jgi:hypothetical protein
MKKKILFIAILVILIAAVALYKFAYKDHREISTETTRFTLTVSDLDRAFTANGNTANEKYADKTLEVSGMVTAFDPAANAVVLDEKLSAVLQHQVKDYPLQKSIRIKGRFVGYDDLLDEFKMDQVTIIK